MRPVFASGQSAARQARRGVLRSFFRSESKALKTALSHDLTGFVAIKPVAKSGEGLRECGQQCKPEPGRVLCWRRLRLWFRLIESMKRMGRPRDAPGFRQRPKRGKASPARRIALFFQERIQGPENGPIARFDGLGRYQTGSEWGDIFGLSGRRAGRRRGFRRLLAFGRLYRRLYRRRPHRRSCWRAGRVRAGAAGRCVRPLKASRA